MNHTAAVFSRAPWNVRSDLRDAIKRNGQKQLLFAADDLRHPEIGVVQFVEIVDKPRAVDPIARAEQNGVQTDLQIQLVHAEPVRKEKRQSDRAERAEQQQNIQGAVRADKPPFRLRALRMNDVRHPSFHAVILQQKCAFVNQTAKIKEFKSF